MKDKVKQMEEKQRIDRENELKRKPKKTVTDESAGTPMSTRQVDKPEKKGASKMGAALKLKMLKGTTEKAIEEAKKVDTEMGVLRASQMAVQVSKPPMEDPELQKAIATLK